jgi:uncharacterized protein
VNLPWYSDGLRFQCTGCGKCCTGAPGYVWVTPDEIAAMAALLKMPLDQFTKKYVRRLDDKYALIEKRGAQPGEYDCIFLKDRQCGVYQARPSQCRTFPFWPENLSSEEAWRETAATCEGINDEAPQIPLTQIQSNLINS